MRGWIVMMIAGATLLIAGCPGGGVVCGDGAVTADCSTDLARPGCLAQGGCWGTWGLAPSPSCNCPTTDAGEPCTSSEACEGDCIATPEDAVCPDEGACSEMERTFGCLCFFGPHGGEEICVD